MAGSVSTAPLKGNVAQGSLSSLAAFPPRRGFDGAASRHLYRVARPRFLRAWPMIIRITLFAARQEPAPPKGNVAQGSLSSPPILMVGGFSTAPWF